MSGTQQTLQSIKSLIDLREKINRILGCYDIIPLKIDQKKIEQKESIIEVRLSGLDKIIFNQNQKEIEERLTFLKSVDFKSLNLRISFK